ncbi:histidine kinase dimerization/phosphoacceptor domain-containing protein, partial [uncultured Agrococcus sp.]|uniref:histidine kinase dimerization/phosphoacceptor domain-containing protein n=1 Tax=uncultured Agrococcus sp. TaxID=382258 RepID=UPI0025FDB6D1
MNVHESRPVQRMRKITTIGAVIAVAVAGITQLLVASDPLWHSALQLPSVAVATWAASRWRTGLTIVQLLPAVAIGALTWIAALLLGMGPLSLIGLVVPVAVTIATMRKHRAIAAVGFVLAVSASSLLVTAVRPDAAEHYLLTSLMYAAMFTGVFWLNDVTWRLFSELETMRRTESELAVIKERFRFASDLHDIQGHTLHVIKLKAAVAARLQTTDPERTAAELEDIQRLTAQTIEQARDLANS